MIEAAVRRGVRSVPLRWLLSLDIVPSTDAVLAAIGTTLGWQALRRKRISRLTVETLPAWLRLLGTMLGASVPARHHGADHFVDVPQADVLGDSTVNGLAARASRARATGSLFRPWPVSS